MTTPFDTVIAATDFSDTATRAVDRAARLARAMDLPLRLVHAVGDGDWLARLESHFHSGFGLEQIARAGQARLKAECERVERAHGPGFAGIGFEQVRGSLAGGLAHLVHPGEHPLLVMGARGQTSWREGVLGSTADRVLRAGRVPVLLVRTDPDPAYRRVALATDFSAASLAAARVGVAMTPGADHYLLHAMELPLDRDLAFANADPTTKEAFHAKAAREAARQLEAFERELALPGKVFTRAPREGAPSSVLASFVEEAAIDLVVIGARARARWEANLLGSTALFATHRLACDLLLVPATPPAGD